jgi:hypothetical protein
MGHRFRKLKQLATRAMSWLWKTLGLQKSGSPADHLVDELFKYGSQYYVSGRYAVLAGLIPLGGNLHHHAIEMLLKGALAKSMTSQKLKDYLKARLCAIVSPAILKRPTRGRLSSPSGIVGMLCRA